MWIIKALGTSVGRKILMAATGLFFCCFLLVHLIGNMMLYGGAVYFNSYAEHLHSLGPLLHIAEILMLVLIIIHISTGLLLFIENRNARPVKYQMSKSGGGRSFASATMPYTGFLILFFVIIHLIKFHFGKPDTQAPYDLVQTAFSNPGIAIFYVSAMVIVAIHVSHGFWSSFQTFGLNHKKYTPAIKTFGYIFSFILGAGFGFIPVWISFLS